jgi:putative ABC transport system substrate-binding protein
MRRREFIAVFGGAASCTCWPIAAAWAQQSALPVVGVLYGVRAADWAGNMDGLHRGLSDMGFIEGRNVAIEYRWAEGRLDRMPAMAADLVARRVAVMVVGGGTTGTREVIKANRTTPIVFTTTVDPVAEGIVASLNRPGGNATGVTSIANEILVKLLELLHDVMPAASTIGLLANPSNPVTSQEIIAGARMAGRRLGLEIIVHNASNENEIESAFAAAVQRRVAALILGGEAYLNSRRNQIAALSLRYALPVIGGGRENVAAGMLMSYTADTPDTYRQAGVYVGRILKGEKPGDLPVVRPTKFGVVVNLKTAKAIGLTIPESFLLRADEVIE